MKAFYTDVFVLPLPDGHRFPMRRYSLLRETILQQGILESHQLEIPNAATESQLQLVHAPEYIRRVFEGELSADEQRRIGFPWSPQMVERSRRSVGATIAGTAAALTEGLGINLAGGTHHAFTDRGAGYCVFNDVAVAIRVHQEQGRIGRAVIIDGDVHQGDGTAAIFRDDPSVFTASLHAKKAFPARKQVSRLDVELDPGADDVTYLAGLDRLLDGIPSDESFDIAYYLAGADPYEGDTLGGLKVSKAGLRERDRRVFTFCRQHGWPVVMAMAGGYAADYRDIVEIQATTIATAREILMPSRGSDSDAESLSGS
ncbi:MAG: histone deacetylase [Planctomycetaceae bacterium]|nr:histone deacetylase [Planctomycetaceae bacterium]